MAGQNRKTFQYRIRRSGQHVADPSRIRRLSDTEKGRIGAATLGLVDLATLTASAEDIATYRRQMGRS